MKIKLDFITNSSSASFYLHITTATELTIEEFQDKFNLYIKDYSDEFCFKKKTVKFYNPREIKQINSNTFEISDWTSMYNDNDDIPHYIRNLLILTCMENVIEYYGFKKILFKIERD